MSRRFVNVVEAVATPLTLLILIVTVYLSNYWACERDVALLRMVQEVRTTLEALPAELVMREVSRQQDEIDAAFQLRDAVLGNPSHGEGATLRLHSTTFDRWFAKELADKRARGTEVEADDGR